MNDAVGIDCDERVGIDGDLETDGFAVGGRSWRARIAIEPMPPWTRPLLDACPPT